MSQPAWSSCVKEHRQEIHNRFQPQNEDKWLGAFEKEAAVGCEREMH